MVGDLDLIVLGSGIAGLTAAERASRAGLRVAVVTKDAIADATTAWAQGGVAAVLDAEDDSIESHVRDTLAAGGGLCDVDAVEVLVTEGPTLVRGLIELGTCFDRDADGRLELAREGGHAVARVVHAGGAATGAEIERALVGAVRSSGVQLLEHTFALDLLVDGGRCRGVRVVDAEGAVREMVAAHVLLASGGAGAMFAVTTNPAASTGDGIAMALRAGVACADLEFVQFHPTALAVGRTPAPLLTEALRGHGAHILGTDGERFVDELLPRDAVSRAITRRMHALDTDHCLLDARMLDDFGSRFPTIARVLADCDLDPARDLLPIAPAAHYLCGGVLTDIHGATTLPGLWAAGEVACSGVHGANRLASNSLLEGLVFGARSVDAIGRRSEGATSTGAMRALEVGDGSTLPSPGRPNVDAPSDPSAIALARHEMQSAMSCDAGVLRDADSLAAAQVVVARAADVAAASSGRDAWELLDLATVAGALLTAAAARTESRGAHTRTDAPDADPARARHLVVR